MKLGASLGAWQPSDIADRLRELALVAEAATIYPYPWNLPVQRHVLFEIRHTARDLGLTLLVHGQCWEVYTASIYPEIRELGVLALKRTVDFAAAVGAVHVTFHPGQNQWPDCWPEIESLALDAEARSLVELSAYAAQSGILIGVENMPAGGNAFRGFVDCTEIRRVLTKAPTLGVTLDVGHVNTAGLDQVDLIRRLGSRINHLHVHDNRGTDDEHLIVGQGTIQWRPIGEALEEIGYDGTVEVERSLADGGVPEALERIREAFGLPPRAH